MKAEQNCICQNINFQYIEIKADLSCKHCWGFLSVYLEEPDLEQKYNASCFKFRTLDLIYVLFEEVLLICEKKKKSETAPHAYAALCSRSRVIVIPRSILE